MELQTFFSGNLLRYFTALEVMAGRSEEFPHRELKMSLELGKSEVKDEVHNVPLSPLLELPSCSQLDTSDTALFAHFIDSTSLSISKNNATLELWQHIVPGLATQHPFLLHGLLAISALHLASLSSDKEAQCVVSGARH